MPELTEMQKPKTAGFVDRGFNHSKKQKLIEEEEKERQISNYKATQLRLTPT